jgi:hypothetical protein
VHFLPKAKECRMKSRWSLANSVALPLLVFVALLQPSQRAFAKHTKPVDAQVAYVAYTAGQIDTTAAELAYERALAIAKKLDMVPQHSDFVARAATTPHASY